MFDMTLYDI